ncbi:hypothetical protein NJ76_16105 [Rhodococcus sp. IITR03]|nr:hypothetical protein NJ76_16105 [Rhodococcus sp. IITR03]
MGRTIALYTAVFLVSGVISAAVAYFVWPTIFPDDEVATAQGVEIRSGEVSGESGASTSTAGESGSSSAASTRSLPETP